MIKPGDKLICQLSFDAKSEGLTRLDSVTPGDLLTYVKCLKFGIYVSFNLLNKYGLSLWQLIACTEPCLCQNDCHEMNCEALFNLQSGVVAQGTESIDGHPVFYDIPLTSKGPTGYKRSQ